MNTGTSNQRTLPVFVERCKIDLEAAQKEWDRVKYWKKVDGEVPAAKVEANNRLKEAQEIYRQAVQMTAHATTNANGGHQNQPLSSNPDVNRISAPSGNPDNTSLDVDMDPKKSDAVINGTGQEEFLDAGRMDVDKSGETYSATAGIRSDELLNSLGNNPQRGVDSAANIEEDNGRIPEAEGMEVDLTAKRSESTSTVLHGQSNSPSEGRDDNAQQNFAANTEKALPEVTKDVRQARTRTEETMTTVNLEGANMPSDNSEDRMEVDQGRNSLTIMNVPEVYVEQSDSQPKPDTSKDNDNGEDATHMTDRTGTNITSQSPILPLVNKQNDKMKVDQAGDLPQMYGGDLKDISSGHFDQKIKISFENDENMKAADLSPSLEGTVDPALVSLCWDDSKEVKSLDAEKDLTTGQASAADPAENAASSFLVNPLPRQLPEEEPLPNTPQQMLDYKFEFKPVDWDEETIFVPMRLAQEPEDEHRLCVDLYAKEYEVEDAIRQMNHLQEVIAAIDEAWGNSLIPPRPGRDKLNALQAEAAQIEKRIKVMEADLDAVKKKHDSHFMSKVDLDLEKTLQNEVETLTYSLWTAPAEQLLELRDKLVEVKKKLKEVADKNAAATKTTKKGGKKSNVKNEGDNDNDESVTTVLPSDFVHARSKYYKLDEDGQARMQEKGLRQITRVLNATTPKTYQQALNNIDVTIRRAAREVRDFLPECSYFSREIALQIHLASSKNYVCRFHSRNRAYKSFDNVITFKGVGHPKAYHSKRGGTISLPHGHMNCGCNIDDILMEFFIWKTFSTTSSNTKITTPFSLTDDNIISPRIRRFWVQHWKEATGLTVNDIYDRESGYPDCVPQLRARSIMRQVGKLGELGVHLDVSPKGEKDADWMKAHVPEDLMGRSSEK